MLVVVLLVLLGCWKLAAAGLLSLGNATHNVLVLHSGNILGLLLALCFNQVLVGREGMVHQLVMQGVNQTSQKHVLPLGISVNILRRIAR
jgi:hypothetical protein